MSLLVELITTHGRLQKGPNQTLIVRGHKPYGWDSVFGSCIVFHLSSGVEVDNTQVHVCQNSTYSYSIIYLVTLHCSVHITPAVQYLQSNITTAQHELIYLNITDKYLLQDLSCPLYIGLYFTIPGHLHYIPLIVAGSIILHVSYSQQ